ncbi:butyrophilin subfamily 1 member A1 isoform X2 [Maylandia zebra]
MSSFWLWLILVFAIFIKSSSAGQINITAVLGENAILPCRVLDGNKTINGLEWSKPELETEYVLLYRDGHLDLFKQHPSFKDRVDLQDRQMKDGNVSLILKNVMTADAGIYAVRKIPETKRRKRAYLGGDPICIITLTVDPPAQTGGHTEDGGKEVEEMESLVPRGMTFFEVLFRGIGLFMEFLALVSKGMELFRELPAVVDGRMTFFEVLFRGIWLFMEFLALVNKGMELFRELSSEIRPPPPPAVKYTPASNISERGREP